MKIPTVILTCTGSTRTEWTIVHLKQAGVDDLDWFVGISGKRSGLKASIPYEIDNPGSGYLIPDKHVGCTLSHLMLWKALWFNGDEDFWMIVEDDVRLRPNWRERVEYAIKTVPEDWDIIYPGSCCSNGRRGKEVGDGLFEGMPLCTHCYIVRCKALPKLIDTNEEIWAPIDLQMYHKSAHLLKCYTLFPRVADQDGTKLHD